MDFAKELFEKQGYGEYVPLNEVDLPSFFLAYSPNPSDSGRIHSDVKQRWASGDLEIIEGMAHFGTLVDQARVALEQSDWEALKNLMKSNFEQRRKLYGDHCLGGENLKMVAIARQFGAAAKFSDLVVQLLAFLLIKKRNKK